MKNPRTQPRFTNSFFFFKPHTFDDSMLTLHQLGFYSHNPKNSKVCVIFPPNPILKEHQFSMGIHTKNPKIKDSIPDFGLLLLLLPLPFSLLLLCSLLPLLYVFSLARFETKMILAFVFPILYFQLFINCNFSPQALNIAIVAYVICIVAHL